MHGLPGPDDLWAKLRDESPDDAAWHPLIAHSIDVACVFEALLAEPTIRRRLARAGGLEDLNEVQVARLCYLVFLHDLGKCHLGFRAKAVPGLGRRCGHIEVLAALSSRELSAAFLTAIDAEALSGWGSEAVDQLMGAVFAHHGRARSWTFAQWRDRPFLAGWAGRGREPLRRLAELAAAGRQLFARAFVAGGAPLPTAAAFQHVFAGLVMLADWIGSAEHWFPFADTLEGRERFARAVAPDILHGLGMGSARSAEVVPDFEGQFGFAPRAGQTAIDHLQLPERTGSVLLLESETGSGKTEAALRWASRLIEAGLVDGCFFAVPLRSAAVQLHHRLQCWATRTFGATAPEVLLAVPGHVRMGEAEGRLLPDFQVQWTDDTEADPRQTRWAAEHPKRYAAANLAVGTIDQVLLGTLPVRHAHLRAACLVRHLLVIDEVHASDDYMTTLVGRMLDLFRAAGGHVLLMSATLGAEARVRLLDRTTQPPPLTACLTTPYPRLELAGQPPVAIQPEGPPKQVAVDLVDAIDDPAAVAGLVADALVAGGRVLVLRNTVRAAIAVQRALEDRLGPEHPALFRVGDVPTLHHGRFASEDRKRLDEAVEQRFGKQAAHLPAVVVGTQTLEQSLDLDADLLITDICPIDVLLQRIGRLHRHEARHALRATPFRTAHCRVLVPANGLAVMLDRVAHGIGKARAYANVVAVEAARQLILAEPCWSIPADNRRLVELGTHRAALDELAEQLGSAWSGHLQGDRGTKGQDRSHARMVTIKFDEPFSEVPWPDNDERLSTRLGAADLLVALEVPIVSPLAPEAALLTHLKLPHWMAPPLPADGELVMTVTGDGLLDLAGKSYRYDRFGLTRSAECRQSSYRIDNRL